MFRMFTVDGCWGRERALLEACFRLAKQSLVESLSLLANLASDRSQLWLIMALIYLLSNG